MKNAIGHTNVYSSYGWLILARVMVLYVPNGYGSFLCLVYATSNQITQFCRVVIFDSVDKKKIVYADILYFVERVFLKCGL
jgi:hypothetical protein